MKAFVLITAIRPFNKTGVSLDFMYVAQAQLAGITNINIDFPDIQAKIVDSDGFKNYVKPSIKALIEGIIKQSLDDALIL